MYCKDKFLVLITNVNEIEREEEEEDGKIDKRRRLKVTKRNVERITIKKKR